MFTEQQQWACDRVSLVKDILDDIFFYTFFQIKILTVLY